MKIEQAMRDRVIEAIDNPDQDTLLTLYGDMVTYSGEHWAYEKTDDPSYVDFRALRWALDNFMIHVNNPFARDRFGQIIRWLLEDNGQFSNIRDLHQMGFINHNNTMAAAATSQALTLWVAGKQGVLDGAIAGGLALAERKLTRAMRHHSWYRRTFHKQKIETEKAVISLICGVIVPWVSFSVLGLFHEAQWREIARQHIANAFRVGTTRLTADVASVVMAYLPEMASSITGSKAPSLDDTEAAVQRIFEQVNVPAGA